MKKTEIIRDPLGRVLLKKGFVTAEQLEAGLSRQKDTKQKLGRTLLDLGHVSGIQLVNALAAQSRIEFIRVGDYQVDPRVVDDVPKVLATRHGILPLLRIGESLFVGSTAKSSGDLASLGTLLNCKVEAIPLGDGVDVASLLDHAYGAQKTRKTRDTKIGQHLVEEKLITEEELQNALKVHGETGQRLGEVIVSLGLLSSRRFHEALGAHLGIPFVTIDHVREAVRAEVARMIPRAFAQHNLVFPFAKEGSTVRVMVTGPLDRWMKDHILEHAQARQLEMFLATEDDIRGAIREAYDVVPEKIDAAPPVIEEPEDEKYDPHAEVTPQTDAAVPKVLNELLFRAMQRRASDIHIECFEGGVVTRLRVDGMLRPVEGLPVDRTNVRRLTTRIKLDCRLDIAERRRPQDGSFTRKFSGNPVDFRVAIQPTLHGENVIIRILDRQRSLPALDELGFQPEILRRYRRMLENPQGMILFTGPTGSGKTTSLYASLEALRKEPIKIITAEDPVEYSFAGIQQCQVNDAIGNGFARYLKAFLRQDPDVILVGEVRDPETAEFAVRAALTGHLVFTTVHTNDTIGTVHRLESMKVDPDLVAASLLCVVSQRLARAICPKCRAPYRPQRDLVAEFYPDGPPEDHVFQFGKGCEKCDYTGYYGRVPVLEFWELDSACRALIQRDAEDEELRRAAEDAGMVSLVEDALYKVERNETTLSEIRELLPFQAIQAHRARYADGRKTKPAKKPPA